MNNLKEKNSIFVFEYNGKGVSKVRKVRFISQQKIKIFELNCVKNTYQSWCISLKVNFSQQENKKRKFMFS